MGLRLSDFPPLIAKGTEAHRKNKEEGAINPNSVKDKSVYIISSVSDGGYKDDEKDGSSKVLEPLGSDLKEGGSWRALFPVPRVVTPQKSWKYTPPGLVKGKRVVTAKSSKSVGANWCDNLVIGFFVGKRLSFSAVQTAVAKQWKLKKEVSIRLYGNGAFIFEFSDEDDRTQVLEMGSLYITSKLFTLRPWSPLIEKSVTNIKSVPIWVCIYGVPLHMWEVDGLGLIASYLGKPLLADECTIKKNRLSYARICIEIDIDFDFPGYIPLLLDDELTYDLPVEYQWRPQICANCKVFGHVEKNCSRVVKAKWIPKRVANPGIGKEVAELVNNNNTVGEQLEDGRSGEASDFELGTISTQVAISEVTEKTVDLAERERPVGALMQVKPDTDIEHNCNMDSMGLNIGGSTVVSLNVVQLVNQKSHSIIRFPAEAPAEVSLGGVATKSADSTCPIENNHSKSTEGITSRIDGVGVGGQRINKLLKVDKEGEWTEVKGRSKVPSPKKNPFITKSDFPYLSKSRFPLERKKQTQAEVVSPPKSRLVEEAKLKKKAKELVRLQWEGSPILAREGDVELGRGCRSQKK